MIFSSLHVKDNKTFDVKLFWQENGIYAKTWLCKIGKQHVHQSYFEKDNQCQIDLVSKIMRTPLQCQNVRTCYLNITICFYVTTIPMRCSISCKVYGSSFEIQRIMNEFVLAYDQIEMHISYLDWCQIRYGHDIIFICANTRPF